MSRFVKPGDDVDDPIYSIETDGELVCAAHFKDDFIQKFILKNGSNDTCSYCGKKKKVAELKDVLEVVVVGLDYLYEDPADGRFLNPEGEHGFDGNTFDFYDLWWEDKLDLKINDTKLIEDSYRYIGSDRLFCERDEYGSESDYYENLWGHFKETVKHKARFVFHYKEIFSDYQFTDPVRILANVKDLIMRFDLIKKIKPNTILYRCRQHSCHNDVKEAKDIASPPDALTKANGRMNPIGISMFYCSTDKNLTILEVADPAKPDSPYCTTAIFRNIDELRLVDLTRKIPYPSIFDAEKNRHIELIDFLERFTEDITQPVRPEDGALEYLPTQVVTEYIRFDPKIKADGIIYPSSKHKSGQNIVLFLNHKNSLKRLKFSPGSIKTRKII